LKFFPPAAPPKCSGKRASPWWRCRITRAFRRCWTADIGGPTLLRAAAKNYDAVTVVVDPADYPAIMEEMQAHQGATTLASRFRLARKVFALTSAYDAAITQYLKDKAV
jgi:AICAR transformylase/IMP cyclohydrolase PurH